MYNTTSHFKALLYISAVSCKTMPSVSNGRITCQNNDAVYGKTCVTACDDGYKLDGDYFVSCDVNGSWSPPGRCKGIRCI